MTGSGQADLLYCWGCRTSAETGELRDSGTTILDYTYGGTPNVIPDLDISRP